MNTTNTQTANKVDYSNLTQNRNWAITFDHEICNDCDNATQEQVDQLLADGFTESFKMYDDDGELYYSGWTKPYADFDPLDDFGRPNAGCTEIKYFNPKTDCYETL